MTEFEWWMGFYQHVPACFWINTFNDPGTTFKSTNQIWGTSLQFMSSLGLQPGWGASTSVLFPSDFREKLSFRTPETNSWFLAWFGPCFRRLHENGGILLVLSSARKKVFAKVTSDISSTIHTIWGIIQDG